VLYREQERLALFTYELQSDFKLKVCLVCSVDKLNTMTYDQFFVRRGDLPCDAQCLDLMEPKRVGHVCYDHNKNVNRSLQCDAFRDSPRTKTGRNEEYQDMPTVGGGTAQRDTVFTVTGFPLRPVTPASKQQQNFGSRGDNSDVGIKGTATHRGAESAFVLSEKIVAQLTDGSKRTRRHDDDDWQIKENALDSDRRRRHFYVTERIIRGDSVQVAPTDFQPRRHHHYHHQQLYRPSTTMFQAADCLESTASRPSPMMSPLDEGNGRGVTRPTIRGEDRLEYELPAVACYITTPSLDAASSIVPRKRQLTSDKPMNQTERIIVGKCQKRKEHSSHECLGTHSGFEFPKISELIWTLPCPRPPKNNVVTSGANLPTRMFAVSGTTQSDDDKCEGSKRQPKSIDGDGDRSRERKGFERMKVGSSYAGGSLRQHQTSDRPNDEVGIKQSTDQFKSDLIGANERVPANNAATIREQDDLACRDQQVTCKQFKVTIFGQRQEKDRRADDIHETAAKKTMPHGEQFERRTNPLAAIRYIDDEDDEVSARCNGVRHANDDKQLVGFQLSSVGSESCPELRSSIDDLARPGGRKRRVRFTLREKRATHRGAENPLTSQDDDGLSIGHRTARSRKYAKSDDQDSPVNYLWQQIVRSADRCNATNASQSEASGRAGATDVSELLNASNSADKTAATSSQAVDLLFNSLTADYKLRSSSTGNVSSLTNCTSRPPQRRSGTERKCISLYQVTDDSQVHLASSRQMLSSSNGVTGTSRTGDQLVNKRNLPMVDERSACNEDDGCQRKSIKELVESFEGMSIPLFRIKAKN
jgi:hypothetical protein